MMFSPWTALDSPLLPELVGDFAHRQQKVSCGGNARAVREHVEEIDRPMRNRQVVGADETDPPVSIGAVGERRRRSINDGRHVTRALERVDDVIVRDI